MNTLEREGDADEGKFYQGIREVGKICRLGDEAKPGGL